MTVATEPVIELQGGLDETPVIDPIEAELEAELEEGKHLLELIISDKLNTESTGHSCIIKAFYINK